MYFETERLIITEFTPDMAKVVQENSNEQAEDMFFRIVEELAEKESQKHSKPKIRCFGYSG